MVTLTVKPGSGSRFAGWTGACMGEAPTFDVTVNGGVNVGATFTLTPCSGGGGGGGGAAGGGTASRTLSVKTAGGRGIVISDPAGISCGKSCSTTLATGTALLLTATPETGFRFVNWTGACTGTQPTCTITVNATGTVQANFTR